MKTILSFLLLILSFQVLAAAPVEVPTVANANKLFSELHSLRSKYLVNSTEVGVEDKKRLLWIKHELESMLVPCTIVSKFYASDEVLGDTAYIVAKDTKGEGLNVFLGIQGISALREIKADPLIATGIFFK